jgi:hypothetical protein
LTGDDSTPSRRRTPEIERTDDTPARAASPRRAHPVLIGTVAAAGLIVIVTGGFILWDRVWRRAGPTNPGMTCPQVVAAHRRPPLALFGVHRVALIGDSIMEQPSCAIAESLAGLGIRTTRHAVHGTGLLTSRVDWIRETRRILQSEKPDVVVAIFVGNYPPPPARDSNGRPIAVDTPAFFAAWQRHAVALSAEVRAADSRMYWASPPPIALPPLNHAQRLFEGYRRIPGDHFLYSGRVLAGRHGEELAAKLTCRHRRVIRSPFDGTHFTDDGARIYGQQIAHDLTADLGILATPQPC